MTTVPGLPSVQRITDPERKAAKAAELLARLEQLHDDQQAQVMAVRDDACRALLANGRSAAEVGRIIGRTRAAVAKRFPQAKDVG